MKKLTFTVLIVILCVFLIQVYPAAMLNKSTLKNVLKKKFLIGAAMNASQIFGTDKAALTIIKQHFNSIVSENCMKSGVIHPREGEFDFEQSDAFVRFGIENDMYIVGHCLIWHSQTPEWFFVDDEGNDVSREVLLERMKTHITTIITRYKSQVNAWDVANEAFLDGGSWRQTNFYKIIGEDYVKFAFRYANEADPEAEFLYNDYSMFQEGRRNAVVKMVRELRAEGIKIDGVGMQAHYSVDYLPLREIEKSIQAFTNANLDVHISELDISVLPFPDSLVGAEIASNFEYQRNMNPYPKGLSKSASAAWNKHYINFFRLLLKYDDAIKRVTTWGVADQHSWRNNWPIRGRTDYPLLFDRDNKAKTVVSEIIIASESNIP